MAQPVWPTPVEVDGVYYDVIQQPEYGNYKPVRMTPKVSFQSDGGYRHQRNQWTRTRKRFEMEWRYLTEAEYNTLITFIETQGSDTFYFVDPVSLWGDPTTGVITPVGYTVRILDSEMPEDPTVCKYRHFKITLEEI